MKPTKHRARGEVTRGQFVRGLAAAGAASVLACGSDDSKDDGADGSSGSAGGGAGGSGGSSGAGAMAGSGSTTCVADIDAQITCRHDHRMIVPAADVAEGSEKTYDIRGTNATHGHDVIVTSEMFGRLRAGETVEIAVPSIFQPHTVYLSCAGLDPSARDDEACN